MGNEHSFIEIGGWLNKKQGFVLQKYAREQQDKFNYDLLEIGSWKGRSSMAIASVLNDDHRLWMIDYFRGGIIEKPSPPSSSKCSRGKTAWAYSELLQTVVRFGMENKVIIFPMTSEQVAKVIKEKFCFIFIDGDHRYEAVSLDWKLWWPRLILGGLCIFHDANYPPIKKFTDELIERSDLKVEMKVHSMLILKKLSSEETMK